MKTYLIFKGILCFTILVLFSCSEPQKKKSKPPPSEELSVDLSTSSADTVYLELRAVGNTMMAMKYNMDVIKVKQNSVVNIRLINEGKDATMHHNIVIMKKGSLEKVGTQAARVGAKRSYVPDIPEVIVASEMAKPGESIDFIFQAPPAGDYVFACTYPGHYLKMKGRFIVIE